MQKIKWYLQISRPRFWIYVFGPFLIGIAATVSTKEFSFDITLALLVTGLFFTFPANLFIYGVNDLFDYETDKHNPKKKAYETLLAPENRKQFINILSIVMVPFVALMSYLFISNDSYIAVWSLALFLFFGAGYSMPPIRTKTKPFLDSFFNILYIFPGFVSFGLLAKTWPDVNIIIAGTAWVMAMHAFSAVPDIKADSKAGIKTVATVLGKNQTVLFCSALYVIAGLLSLQYLGVVSIVGMITYGTLMILALRAHYSEGLFAVYRAFPYVNMIFGFVLFWYTAPS